MCKTKFRLRLQTIHKNWTVCSGCGRKIKLGERYLDLSWDFTPGLSPGEAVLTGALSIKAHYRKEAHICLTCGPRGVKNQGLQAKAAKLQAAGIARGRDKLLLARIAERCHAAELEYRKRQDKRVARLAKV